MLSPVWHLLFLLSVIKYCVAILDLGIQDSELLPSPNIEPNNLVLALESPDGTDTRESSEPPLIQSNDQCRYNANQESRKIRSKRGEFCSSLRQPVRDNGRNGREEPPYLPQIVPQAGKTPASEKSDQPNPDDNLCPPTARYPVCADPVVFPIAPDALFRQHELDISRMQLKYCRASAPPCPNPGDGFWCCDFAFTSRSEFEPQPLLRVKYPNTGIGCIEMYARQW